MRTLLERVRTSCRLPRPRLLRRRAMTLPAADGLLEPCDGRRCAGERAVAARGLSPSLASAKEAMALLPVPAAVDLSVTLDCRRRLPAFDVSLDGEAGSAPGDIVPSLNGEVVAWRAAAVGVVCLTARACDAGRRSAPGDTTGFSDISTPALLK